MDTKKFLAIFQDSHFSDLKKMVHKYSKKEVQEVLQLLSASFYQSLSIRDFTGKELVYLPERIALKSVVVKNMAGIEKENPLQLHETMHNEIESTLEIENFTTSRQSLRRMLSDKEPENEEEVRVAALRDGLRYISDLSNHITEQNLAKLYTLAIAPTLQEENKLQTGNLYRHDSVYIRGSKNTVEHQGLDHTELPVYMKEFISFINQKNVENALAKAAIIHFYLVYLHPYFDGNGRMARLLQQWFLLQNEYKGPLSKSLSEFVEKTKPLYYKAILQVEENRKISGVLDVTPFLTYFSDYVYEEWAESPAKISPISDFQKLVEEEKITQKEHELWKYIVLNYGQEPFSTKQLEKDFGSVSYETIRQFVKKMVNCKLLDIILYSNRPKYHVVD